MRSASAHHPTSRHALVPLIALVCAALAAPAVARADDAADRAAWARHTAALEAAIDREPGLPGHWLRLAQAWARQGDAAKARDACERALARGADPRAVDLLLGDLYAEQNAPKEALKRYLRVLKTSPRQSHALTQLWRMVQRARLVGRDLPGDTATLTVRLNALGYYVASTPAPEAPDAERSRARLREGHAVVAKRPREALRAYREAARLDPWSADAYRALGIALARLGDPTRAAGAYRLFAALAPPDHPDLDSVRAHLRDFDRLQEPP